MNRIFKPFRVVSEMIGDAVLKAHIAAENRKAEAREILAALPEEDRRHVEATQRKFALFGAATGMFVLAGGEAFAANKAIGDILTNVNQQVSNAAPLAGTASFLLGSVTAISGFNSLKKHSENPNDPAHTVKSGSIKIGAGAGLVGLGATLGSGLTTIFGDTTGSMTAGGNWKSLQ